MKRSLQEILDSGISSPEHGIFFPSDVFNSPDDLAHYKGCQKLLIYWKKHIATESDFAPKKESLAVILLDKGYRITGHYYKSMAEFSGSNSLAREIFKTAFQAKAPYVIVMFNSPLKNSRFAVPG